jgi:L-aminopeptidase/D-esterase-like protein
MMVAALPFTAVAGLKVGHFTDPRRPTGCTVVLCESGAVAGVDVRGAAPGTRETELLAPTQTVERVHAILLAGGSAFGLDAASGVVRWLEERGVGLDVGPARVPIVPAAILFDLALGDPHVRPDAAAGYAACSAASGEPPAQGSIGAGAGATVGKLFGFERAMKGGIGHAALRVGGVTVAALVAVNAVGDVVDPQSGRIVAGARGDDGRTLGQTAALLRGQVPALAVGGAATTIGVIATDARLTKAQATRLAQLGHDGLARTIDPVHTAIDGDTLFALATGTSTSTADPIVLGTTATAVVAQAVLNAVRHAAGVPGVPSARDLGLGDAVA